VWALVETVLWFLSSGGRRISVHGCVSVHAVVELRTDARNLHHLTGHYHRRTTLRGRSVLPGLDVDAATSLRMALVRQRGTAAELAVRRALRELGHRYRVRNRDLPGSPDAANRTRRWAVFVHGCFWHRHDGCVKTTTPKRNRPFWEAKFDANQKRDRRAVLALRRLGFAVVIVWECEAEQSTLLIRKLRKLSRRRVRRPTRTAQIGA
jgi:DNA mismatch endonuclease (patch repair protein)